MKSVMILELFLHFLLLFFMILQCLGEALSNHIIVEMCNINNFDKSLLK